MRRRATRQSTEPYDGLAISVTTSFRIEGYNYREAPAILIPQNPIHKAISDIQNARRDAMTAAGQDPWATGIQDQFNYSPQDMRAAGNSDDCRKRALKKAYKYFDKLGAIK